MATSCSSLMAAIKPVTSPFQFPFSQNPPKTLRLPVLSAPLKKRSIQPSRDDLVMSASRNGPMRVEACDENDEPPEDYESYQGVSDQFFNHRIIRLVGPLEDDNATQIVSDLLYLDGLDPTRDIVMYINSPGGTVTAGMAIFDMMRHIRCDVSTVCVGLAASISGFILSAGTKGKRYSLPNARIMINQQVEVAQGSHLDMEIQVSETLHRSAALCGYLAHTTGQPLEKVMKDTERDLFMSPKEAQEYGIVDGIITNPLKATRPKSA